MLKTLITTTIAACSLLAAAEPFEVKTLEIGASAPAFSLPGVDGKTHSLEDFAKSKVLAVIFTCNHCPEAYAAAGRIQETADKYASKGVAVVAISGNDPLALRADELGYAPHGDSFEEMKLAAKEANWTIPYLYDGETQSVTRAYGAQSTPHVFVFDAARKLRYTGRMDEGYRKSGPVEKSQMIEAIDALLAGQEVPVATTRSYGCSTKWSYKREHVAKDNADWNQRAVTVDTLDGATAKALAANATEKVRLINFWATTCGPCVAELPDLVETARRFQNRPFELITISTDPAEASKRVLSVLKAKKVATPQPREAELAQENRKSNNYQVKDGELDAVADAIAKDWNGALPYSVLIAPNGKVLWKHQGEVDIVEVRREIVKALSSH
ncbi:MAG: redoxin [Verrucomicrobia bacterium]|jgi:peroxiredoxin|nr:MAG: redoxin [Verrucomicrobiota bacterium]